MSKFIRVRRGDKIVLRVKKRRKQATSQPAPPPTAKRGLLPVIEMDSPYRPRRGGRGIEVFDLAVNADGTYPNFPNLLTGLTGYPIAGQPDRIFHNLSFYNPLMFDRFNAQNFKKIEYEHSWTRFTDLVFYDGNNKNILALSEPEKRTYLADKTFLVSNTAKAASPKGFNAENIKEATFKHLRVNSAVGFYQFDTGDTTNFRLTSVPEYIADYETGEAHPRAEINFANKKKIELYLVPRFWRVGVRHSADYPNPLQPSVFYRTELSGGTYAPFPRAFLDALDTYGISQLNLNRAKGGETSLLNNNHKYFKFMPGTLATVAALKTFNSAFVSNLAHNRVEAREKLDGSLGAPAIPNLTVQGWAQMLTNLSATTTSFRRFSFTDESLAPYRGEPAITGNPIPNGEENRGYFAPDRGSLLAIIKADDALFYVWNEVSNILDVADSRYLPPAAIRFATTLGFAPPTPTVDSSIHMDLYAAGLTQDTW